MIDDMLNNVDEATRRQVEANLSALKKYFKGCTKNELIKLLIEQVELCVHQQNINKVLIQKIDGLKAADKGEVK